MNIKKYPLHQALENIDVEKIKTLLIAGEDVNLTNFNGNTPLYQALICNIGIDIMKILVKYGADINLSNKIKRSPLQTAIICRAGIDIIKFLVENGANVNHINLDHQTPLLLALNCNAGIDIVKYLIENGADVNLAVHNELVPIHVALDRNVGIDILKLFVKHGADLNWADRFGRTGLHIALSRNLGIDIVKFLIENGADVNPPIIYCGWDMIYHALANNKRMYLPIFFAAGLDNDYDYRDCDGNIKIGTGYTISKKNIELVGFNAICERAGTICIAMQKLNLPTPLLTEIIEEACIPFAKRLPYHYLWDLVVVVKHFHDRQSKMMSEKEMMEKEMMIK
jgi:ankyrin repeat protein